MEKIQSFYFLFAQLKSYVDTSILQLYENFKIGHKCFPSLVFIDFNCCMWIMNE